MSSRSRRSGIVCTNSTSRVVAAVLQRGAHSRAHAGARRAYITAFVGTPRLVLGPRRARALESGLPRPLGIAAQRSEPRGAAFPVHVASERRAEIREVGEQPAAVAGAADGVGDGRRSAERGPLRTTSSSHALSRTAMKATAPFSSCPFSMKGNQTHRRPSHGVRRARRSRRCVRRCDGGDRREELYGNFDQHPSSSQRDRCSRMSPASVSYGRLSPG